MTASVTKASDVPAGLNLTSEPDSIILSPSIFVYLEKLGPFVKTAPLAWKEFWSLAAGRLDQSQFTGMAGLSRIDGTKAGDAALIYQAGVLLKEEPESVPNGLQVRSLSEKNMRAFC